MITPISTGMCQFTMNVADITAHSAMPVPTDRSMPPVMMTRVAPNDRRPITTAENRIWMTFV